ncbi:MULTISPECIES: transposase [Serratia]|uniref:transposase n=1 Tax=Serratia TaxID=613 RepID=UPI003703AFF1
MAHNRKSTQRKQFCNIAQGRVRQGETYWHVYFAKPTKHARQTANYLGRYLKKAAGIGGPSGPLRW